MGPIMKTVANSDIADEKFKAMIDIQIMSRSSHAVRTQFFGPV